MEFRTIHIADMLDVYSASMLAETIKRALVEPGDIAADLGGSEPLHTAALQVLLSAKRQCGAEQRQFVLTGVSQVVRRQLELAGLQGLIAPQRGVSSAERREGAR